MGDTNGFLFLSRDFLVFEGVSGMLQGFYGIDDLLFPQENRFPAERYWAP